jgi:hypothetical protein
MAAAAAAAVMEEVAVVMAEAEGNAERPPT